MYIKEDDLKLNDWQFSQRKYLPWKAKLRLTETRIREWYEYWEGNVRISYSGGLDSTVLLDLIRKIIGTEVPAVFSNTGMEFPEIVRFARKASGEYKEIYPTDKNGKRITFADVVRTEGFPLISKETANKIRKLRHGNLSDKYRNYLLHGDERGSLGKLSEKWKILIHASFDTSDKCCDILKKSPFKKYDKEHGTVPFIGITQNEGLRRARQYARTGCNIYDKRTPKSQPLGFWTKQDVLRYVVENDLEICSVYGDIKQKPCGEYYLTGEQRTGCALCGFGCHLEGEPNHIQKLSCSSQKSHRKMYLKGMELKNNGITYRKALEYCGIPVDTWENAGQMSLADIPGVIP